MDYMSYLLCCYIVLEKKIAVKSSRKMVTLWVVRQNWSAFLFWLLHTVTGFWSTTITEMVAPWVITTSVAPVH